MDNESFFDELSGYDVDEHGVICSPGKFEGEPSYVLYFWMSVMDGCYDDEYFEDDISMSMFVFNADDIKLFPELREYERIVLWEDSQGFVHHELRE